MRTMIRINFKTISALFVVITLILTSCKKETSKTSPGEPVPIALTTNQISLIGSGNIFAFNIFRKVVDNAAESENVIISPLSISTALSMTLNGANGSTLGAMLTTLSFDSLTPAIINSSYKSLTQSLLNVDKQVLISIANSVWSEKNFVVKKPFADILTGYYNSESRSFDITDPQAPAQINKWIDTKTNGLITNMVDKLDPTTVMLLINAIYFKGKWKSQFDVANTVQGSFYKPGNVTEQVPMMKQTSDYKIYKGEGFTLAELPYGQGNFVMDVILPDDNNGIDNLISLIDSNTLNGWLNMMSSRKTDLSFPRFKYGYKKELTQILTDMGMGITFGNYADFSNISDLKLYISLVLHQAVIETNEEGTEAAAATIVGISNTAVMEPLTLSIDHSFMYIIRETTTNSILFMGRVVDPLSN
jgi:serine protease inhibitor